MQDYEEFVQHRLSELRKSTEEELRPTTASSSLILFHGRAILPPLLSEKEKEEMRLYRKQVKKDTIRRKLKDNPRMAYVQTILHSVQLRTTPTLDELLQERHINGSAETKDGPSPPLLKETSGVALPPLTSTACSAFLSSEPSHQERCLIEKSSSQPVSQPSSFVGAAHQSLSSGYLTFDDVENSKSPSDKIEMQTQGSDRVSSEGVFNLCGFFLHSSSGTIAKIPDIISHPPIDGEELERSGLEISICHSFTAIEESRGSSFQEDSVMDDHSPASLNNVEHEEEFQAVTSHLGQNEDSFSLSENCSVSDNPDTSQTLSDYNQKTEPSHLQEDDSDSVPSAEPHRLSLQALLKKSQEYRRHQRMLRNQTRNGKFQDRNRGPPRSSADDQSNSDKENDGFPQKITNTAVGKKMKQATALISSDSHLKKSWENEKTKEGEIILWSKNDQSENTHSQGNENAKESVEKETNFRNQQICSQDVKGSLTQSRAFIKQQQPESAGVCPVQEAFYSNMTGRKYHTVPMSNQTKTPEGNVFSVNSCSKQKTAIPHQPENDMAESVVSNVSSESSQHIDLLESNLSRVKVLISDLDFRVRENFTNQCPSEKTPSDLSLKEMQQLAQQVCDSSKVNQSDSGGEDEDEGRTSRRQSIDNFPQGSQLESHFTSTKFISLHARRKEVETSNETSLGKSSTKGQELSDEKHNVELTKHGACRKPLQAAKGSLSVAQWLRIPEIFRNVSSENSNTCDISVVSESCDHPVETMEEIHAECYDSIPSPSLNQSYDVDTPSGLWFEEEFGTNADSRGCLVDVQHLTPESRNELEPGTSKAKRKLALHLFEGVQENQPQRSGVRPGSSTPRAAWRGWEGPGNHRDQQEQLKQAHAAQLRALQEEHQKQQEELLQVLSERYRLPQSASLPCSKSSSQLGDTLTFSTPAQTSCSASQRYLPLLAAVTKGFLTRRMLRTERAAQLVRTIRDTQLFLQGFGKQQMISGRQDVVLLERVTLQLRAAKFELHDTFFSLSVREQMQLIGRDRELNKERELRRLSGNNEKGKGSLSAATRKSLERKRGELKRAKRQTSRKLEERRDFVLSNRWNPEIHKSKETLRGSQSPPSQPDPDKPSLTGFPEDQ